MSEISGGPNVLLVGAYERDNFGDLLFFQLTREYLSDFRVTAGSIIGADMTGLLGTMVHPHNSLLARERWDAIWVVGGEVGGVSAENALTMSLNDSEGGVFDRVSAIGRDAILSFLADSSAIAPAYFPQLSRFSLNRDTPLIINSVGLATMQPQGASDSDDLAISALRGATALHVRDPASAAFAADAGLKATLGPDMVHAISILHPELGNGSDPEKDPYFLFQANANLIGAYGAEAIAQSLVDISETTGWRPVLFLAGVARHHDRSDQYDEVIRAIHQTAPSLHAMVISTRNPLELAGWIARSQLWIGSSLHGRIIAGSFAKPRVSLENRKVETYASKWDVEFPTKVGISSMTDSVSVAISKAQIDQNVRDSVQLSHIAHDATQNLVRTFL
ncbi:polysaccharide pyruvyl transferase family protein [Cryobacterium sp. CG_9.6]|uniref:polysaccharide pyruvyl transferase family protein n=1 Tax=Cryobacterium sp. CG_9.6 TaxID=2760710 RepID=UPI002473A62F|nr:polysaccharide pyruvyl transferase family protein [Cryobacterium sp. CG_9.6]MDH6235935.1 polysaccharide pyruvyl transferase WcaK-like protein [Cryobacterium sp. CG_9.6]